MCLLVLLLGFALFSQSRDDSRPFPKQLKAVVESIDKAVKTEYYDRQAAAAWLQHEKRYESQIFNAETEQEAVEKIRATLAQLHNSHVLFYTRDEWSLRQNVLPITFEKRKGRVFVRSSLTDKLRFGDEITLVDSQPTDALQPKSLAKLAGVFGNSLYGPPSSIATITVISSAGIRTEQLQRVKWTDVNPIKIEQLGSNVVLVQLLSLPGDEEGIGRLEAAWAKAMTARALVLDLRDCDGGWPSASSYLLDSLLGNSRKPFKILDREGVELAAPETSFTPPRRFIGRVVVLIGSGTESECEVVAAGLKEGRRAVLVGHKTAGALNGFTKSVSLPGDFALFALPYTRTLSPENASYEGKGVSPDISVTNRIEDFRAAHDRVLDEAKRLIR